jgi:cysteinyl-tRNA synthetase
MPTSGTCGRSRFRTSLRRWSRSFPGFALDNVMNITDVDDKIIRAAMGQGKTLRQEYTAEYEAAFSKIWRRCASNGPNTVVRATEHIGEMVDLIQQLGAKGFTYESDGSTDYRIARTPEYGKLCAPRTISAGRSAGARVDVDEHDEDDARDFVLWKQKNAASRVGDTPIGDGRPAGISSAAPWR